MISRNFGCDTPPGLRLMTKTCSTSGWFRHSSRTPSPTIPVAPVMIALVFIHCVLPTPPVLPALAWPLVCFSRTRIIDQIIARGRGPFSKKKNHRLSFASDSESTHDERAIHPLSLLGGHGAICRTQRLLLQRAMGNGHPCAVGGTALGRRQSCCRPQRRRTGETRGFESASLRPPFSQRGRYHTRLLGRNDAGYGCSASVGRRPTLAQAGRGALWLCRCRHASPRICTAGWRDTGRVSEALRQGNAVTKKVDHWVFDGIGEPHAAARRCAANTCATAPVKRLA